MAKPAPTGIAADFRARMGARGIAMPLRADDAAPGYILDARGRRVMAVNVAGLAIESDQALAAARDLATAINWYGGLQR